MEELWKTLPVAGPVGVVLVIVVVAFLKHLATRERAQLAHLAESDRANREERKALGERLDRVVDEQLARSNEAMARVATAVEQQGNQCERMRDFVQEMMHKG